MSASDKRNLKRWSLNGSGYFTATKGGPHIPLAGSPFQFSLSTTDTATFGANLPNWRKLVAKGENATTTMEGVRTQVRPREGFRSYLYADGTVAVVSGVIDQSCMSIVSVAHSLGPVADAKARSKFLDKYIGIKSTWRGGNFLAEIGETMHMFLHPVRSFYNATYQLARNLRKIGKIYAKNPVNYSKALADLWLAYSFGVKPTVEDANDLANTLNSLINRQFIDTKGIRASGHNSAVTTTVGPYSPSIGGMPSSPTEIQEVIDKSDAHVWYRGAVICKPQNANRFLLQSFGVDVFDVVPAVWEAIPWSFFIDYFLNVQEMLDSMRYVDAEFGWLNRTYRNARTINASSIRGPLSLGTTQIYGSGGGGYRLGTYVSRVPIPSPPYPSWTFKFPKFPSLKWLNIEALALQIELSRPKKIILELK